VFLKSVSTTDRRLGRQQYLLTFTNLALDVFQRSLRNYNTGEPVEGKVKIAITPSPVPQQQPQRRKANFANVQQLLKDISDHPLPEGWQMQFTNAGRVFFLKCFEEPPPIACSSSLPPTAQMLTPRPAPVPTRILVTAAAYVE
jgi:hypothetical protein